MGMVWRVIQADLMQLAGTLTICMVVAGVCRVRGWSGALPLLFSGIIVALLPVGPTAPRSAEFVLIVILAPLVFGEALGSSIIDMRRVGRPVLVLATLLVLFGAFCVGVVAQRLVPDFSWPVAFALGAILGPTDAVAVSTTAKRAGLPRRMVNILEGESMVNDGTALTLLRVFSVMAAAGSVSAGDAALILAASVLGGGLVGAAGGLLLVWTMRGSRDPLVTNSLILVGPFPIYALAEEVGGSGILAVVVAGLIVAHGAANQASYAGRLQATAVWRVITFVLQSVAFFMVGLELPRALRALEPDEVPVLWIAVPVVLVTLVASRFVFVYVMTHMPGRANFGRSWVVAAWAGTRGPISALAALTMPEVTTSGEPIPGRDLLVSITFLVVVASLLLAPTIAGVAKRLGLRADDDRAIMRRARLATSRAALDRLEAIEETAERRELGVSEEVFAQLRAEAEARMERASARAQAGDETAPLHLKAMREIALEMIHAEQEELMRMRDEGDLPDSLMRELQMEADQRARALTFRG